MRISRTSELICCMQALMPFSSCATAKLRRLVACCASWAVASMMAFSREAGTPVALPTKLAVWPKTLPVSSSSFHLLE